MIKQILTNQKSNIVTVRDMDFLNNIEPTREMYIKWVGGTNGSGQPQLQNPIRGGNNNQVAHREIFSQYYGIKLQKNKYNHIHITRGKDAMGRIYPSDDVNPLHMVIMDTRSKKMLDITGNTRYRARNLIENFII